MKQYKSNIELKSYIDNETYNSYTVGCSVNLVDDKDIAPKDLNFKALLGFEISTYYCFMSGVIERGLLNLREKTDDERCYMYLFNLRGFIFELLVWFDKNDDISDIRLNVWTDNSEFEAGLDPVKTYYMGQVSFFYNS